MLGMVCATNWLCIGERDRVVSLYYQSRRGQITRVITAGGPDARRAPGTRSGCASLLAEVRRAGPRLVVGGHVHAAHGAARAGGTAFVNAASCGAGGDSTEGYLVEWPPVVVDL
jgi:hypothetical protein